MSAHGQERDWTPEQLARINAEFAEQIIDEIAEVLRGIPCAHGETAVTASTPPMFYPESLKCALGYMRRMLLGEPEAGAWFPTGRARCHFCGTVIPPDMRPFLPVADVAAIQAHMLACEKHPLGLAVKVLSRIADRDIHGMDIVGLREEAQAALDKILPSGPAAPPAEASPASSKPPAIEEAGDVLPQEGLLDHLFKQVVVGDAETRAAIADERGGEGGAE